MSTGVQSVFTGVLVQGATTMLMARVTGSNGIPVLQADVSAIAYTVYDISTSGSEIVVTASTSLTVSAVVFNTMQTDAKWDVDDVGYNFLMVLPAASLPNGKKSYQIAVKFTFAVTGYVAKAIFEGTTLKDYGA